MKSELFKKVEFQKIGMQAYAREKYVLFEIKKIYRVPVLSMFKLIKFKII